MLGFVMVRNLVLGNSMTAAFRNTKGMDLQQFWRYNLYTACAARWLANRDGANADLVFTVGLMHGIGQLHLHAAAPEAMLPIDKRSHVLDTGRAELEQQTLGFHNGEVAAALAKLWNFPEPIIVAMQCVPLPLSAPEFSEAAAWVHLGAWRSRTDVLGTAPAEALASYPAEVGKRLGIAADWAPAHHGAQAHSDDQCMPPLKDLTEGLEAMLS